MMENSDLSGLSSGADCHPFNCQEVLPYPLDKIIEVPTSKSYTNRYLILACLYPAPVKLKNFSKSTDVLNLIQCLKKLGLEIEIDGPDLLVTNSFPACEPQGSLDDEVIELESGDGGTTNRFLLALISKGKRKYRVLASGEMKKRPMGEYYKLLRSLGVHLEVISKTCNDGNDDQFPVEIQGPAVFTENIEIVVDCSQTSQFISALTLAFCETKVKWVPLGLDSSQDYYALTLKIIKQFHFESLRKNLVFSIPIDFSSITYPLALALMTGKVLISNCHFIDMLQPDSHFFKVIKEMGGSYKIDEKGLIVSKAERLKGVHVDCSAFPDLVPTLAFLCAYAEGESRLMNIENLKYKESDRILEISKILHMFSVAHTYVESTHILVIEGKSPKIQMPQSIDIADHRMIMLAYLFMRVSSGGKIFQWAHVNKSFENFFQVMG